jgi:hypothetical protein
LVDGIRFVLRGAGRLRERVLPVRRSMRILLMWALIAPILLAGCANMYYR